MSFDDSTKEHGGDMYKKVIDNRLFIIAKNEAGIETHRKEYTNIYAVNPRLNSIFVADLVFQLSLLPKDKRALFKKIVCETLEINPETLHRAITRYYHNLHSNLGIPVSNLMSNYSDADKIELIDDIGTLDDDHWTVEIQNMANNLSTIPPRYREEKYHNAIELIHKKYGKDEIYTDYYKNQVNFINLKGTFVI